MKCLWCARDRVHCTNAPKKKVWLNLPDWFEDDLERSTPERISYDIPYVHFDWSLVETRAGIPGIVTSRRTDDQASSDSSSSSEPEEQYRAESVVNPRREERRPLRSALSTHREAATPEQGDSSAATSRMHSLRFDLPAPRTVSPEIDEPSTPTPHSASVPPLDLPTQQSPGLTAMSGYTLASVPRGAWPSTTDTRQLSASRDSVPPPRSVSMSPPVSIRGSHSAAPFMTHTEAPRVSGPRMLASDFRFSSTAGTTVSVHDVRPADGYFRSRFDRIENNDQLLEAQHWIWHLRARRSMRILDAQATAHGIEQAQLSLRQLMDTCERLLGDARNAIEQLSSDYAEDDFLIDRMMEYSWRQLNGGMSSSSSGTVVPTASVMSRQLSLSQPPNIPTRQGRYPSHPSVGASSTSRAPATDPSRSISNRPCGRP